MDSKNKETLWVTLSCALGGGIGTLVALSLNGMIWWHGLLVGLFVGALAGRMSFHPVQLAQDFAKSFQRFSACNFKEKWEDLEIKRMIFSGLIFLTWCMPLWYVLRFHPTYLSDDKSSGWPLWIGAISVLDFFLGIFALLFGWKFNTQENRIQFLIRYNIIVVSALLLFYAALVIVYMTASLIIAITAREGLAVMCGSLMGALVGYYTQSPLVGASAGGCAGFVQFKLLHEHLDFWRVKLESFDKWAFYEKC